MPKLTKKEEEEKKKKAKEAAARRSKKKSLFDKVTNNRIAIARKPKRRVEIKKPSARA
jgi:hypothetical protein